MKPDETPPTGSGGHANWDEQPLEWPRSIGQVDLLMSAIAVREKRRRRRRIAAAASGVAALAFITVGLTQFSDKSHPAIPSVMASTSPKQSIVMSPEQRTLPDGSVVELNAGAEISIDFGPGSSGLRRVALLRGEVHFQVAKDPARPFVVEARGVQFRAVGTAFSVEVAPNKVAMLVTEGRVAVDREPPKVSAAPAVTADDSPRETPVLVGAGERVVVDVTGSAVPSLPDVIATTTSERAEILAWRIPRIDFNEMKLANVVDLLSRHSGRRITLGSARLGGLEISGVLRADNVESLLQMLEANYAIHAVRHEDGSITLQPAR